MRNLNLTPLTKVIEIDIIVKIRLDESLHFIKVSIQLQKFGDIKLLICRYQLRFFE